MKNILTVVAMVIASSIASPPPSRGQVPEIPPNLQPGEYIKNIIPMRDRVQMMERALRWKKEHVLPKVMREQNIDMWIIRNDEACAGRSGLDWSVPTCKICAIILACLAHSSATNSGPFAAR